MFLWRNNNANAGDNMRVEDVEKDGDISAERRHAVWNRYSVMAKPFHIMWNETYWYSRRKLSGLGVWLRLLSGLRVWLRWWGRFFGSKNNWSVVLCEGESSSWDEPSSWDSYISSSEDIPTDWDRETSSSGDEPSSWDESSSGSFLP